MATAQHSQKSFPSENVRMCDNLPAYLSHHEYPADVNVFSKLGMPLGCTIAPFSNHKSVDITFPSNRNHISKIARCGQCQAYINSYCKLVNSRWFCSICGARNVFTRTMLRYRQEDYAQLPEICNPVNDFPCDFRKQQSLNEYLSLPENQNPNVAPNFTEPVPSSTRPLVHIFVIQESMGADTMEASIEALTEGVRSLHPDYFVALVTFSNRLGVYQFNGGATHKATDIIKPTIQFLHFTYRHVNMNLLGMIPLLSPSEQNSQGNIYETSELSQLFHYDGQLSFSNEILTQLHETCEFLDSIVNVGLYRDSILNTINNLSESFSTLNSSIINSSNQRSLSSKSLNRGRSSSSSSKGNSPSYEPRSKVPTVLLGPMLEAISSWILQNSAELSSFSLDNNYVNPNSSNQILPLSPSSPPSGFLNLINSALTNLSINLVGGGGDYDVVREPSATARNSVGSNPLSPLSPSSKLPSPASLCSGIVLHLFFSSPQDLPPKAHYSCPSDVPVQFKSLSEKATIDLHQSNGLGWPVGICKNFVEGIAHEFAQAGVSAHLWAITNFKSQSTDLHNLGTLALWTGGEVYRCILGINPHHERMRLTEKFVRTLTEPRATKCIFKLRTTPTLDVVPNGILGAIREDATLKSIYHMSSCTPASNVSIQFGMKQVDLDSTSAILDSHSYVKPSHYVQLAFEYETLIEDSNSNSSKTAGLSPIYVNDKVRSTLINTFNQNKTVGLKQFSLRNPSNLSSRRRGDSDIPLRTSFSPLLLNRKRVESADVVLSQPRLSSTDSNNMEEIEEEGYEYNDIASPMSCLISAEDTNAWADEKLIESVAEIFNMGQDYDNYRHWRDQQMSNELESYEMKSFIKSTHKKKSVKPRKPKATNLTFIDEIKQDKKAKFRFGYNHNKSLFVIRQLRVITFPIECNDSIPYLLRSTEIEVVVALLARQAFLFDAPEFQVALPKEVTAPTATETAPSSVESSHERLYQSLSKGIRFVIDWMTSIVYAAAMHAKSADRESRAESRVNSLRSSPNTAASTLCGSGNSRFSPNSLTPGASVDNLGSSVSPTRSPINSPRGPRSPLQDMLLILVFKNHEVSQLLKLTLGIINTLIDCNEVSQQDNGDFATELLYLVLTTDPSISKKFFYPELHSLDSRLIIQSFHYPLALKQESMTMASLNKSLLRRSNSSGSGSARSIGRMMPIERNFSFDDKEFITGFFLDCGNHFILYRKIQSNNTYLLSHLSNADVLKASYNSCDNLSQAGGYVYNSPPRTRESNDNMDTNLNLESLLCPKDDSLSQTPDNHSNNPPSRTNVMSRNLLLNRPQDLNLPRPNDLYSSMVSLKNTSAPNIKIPSLNLPLTANSQTNQNTQSSSYPLTQAGKSNQTNTLSPPLGQTQPLSKVPVPRIQSKSIATYNSIDSNIAEFGSPLISREAFSNSKSQRGFDRDRVQDKDEDSNFIIRNRSISIASNYTNSNAVNIACFNEIEEISDVLSPRTPMGSSPPIHDDGITDENIKSFHKLYDDSIYDNEHWLINDIARRLLKMPSIVPRFDLAEAGKESAHLLTDKLIEESGISGLTLEQYIDIVQSKTMILMKS